MRAIRCTERIRDFSRLFDAEGAKSGRGPAQGLAGFGVLSFDLKGENSMEIVPLEISFFHFLPGSRSAALCFSRGCFEGAWLWRDHLCLCPHPLGETTAVSPAERSLGGDAEVFPVPADTKCKAWTFRLQFLGSACAGKVKLMGCQLYSVPQGMAWPEMLKVHSILPLRNFFFFNAGVSCCI